MNQPKQVSRQVRALQWRRDQVLDAAEAIFASKGFHEATMQEIARKAEYATGTLYTLFDNKEALFAAVVQKRLPEIEAHLRREVERGASPLEKIEHFVRAFFQFFDERQHLFLIYVNVTGGFLWNVKAELGEHVFRSHLAFLAFLEAIFRDGIRRGEFRRDIDARLLAVSLVSILTGAATDWITRAPAQPFHPILEGTQGLLRALLAPQEAPARGNTARKRAGRARRRDGSG
jgi:AcrR family transcriptional regulator